MECRATCAPQPQVACTPHLHPGNVSRRGFLQGFRPGSLLQVPPRSAINSATASRTGAYARLSPRDAWQARHDRAARAPRLTPRRERLDRSRGAMEERAEARSTLCHPWVGPAWSTGYGAAAARVERPSGRSRPPKRSVLPEERAEARSTLCHPWVGPAWSTGYGTAGKSRTAFRPFKAPKRSVLTEERAEARSTLCRRFQHGHRKASAMVRTAANAASLYLSWRYNLHMVAPIAVNM